MAAAKTSLVLFLFALIAVSANLQMASAVGLQCATELTVNLNILNGCTSNADCAFTCDKQCLAQFQVKASASACVAGILGALVNSCSCCCVAI